MIRIKMNTSFKTTKRINNFGKLRKVLRGLRRVSNERSGKCLIVAWNETVSRVFAAVDRVAASQPEYGQSTAGLRLGNGNVGGGGLLLSCNKSDHGRVSPVQVSQRFLRARENVERVEVSNPVAAKYAPTRW